MRVFFDDDKFSNDLDKVVAPLDKWNKPLVVLPTEKDVKTAKINYISDPNTCHVTFISFDYWLSKKWIADDDYDHIDFFRVDQAIITRCYGIRTGCMTVRRTIKKMDEVKGEE